VRELLQYVALCLWQALKAIVNELPD